MTALPSSLGFRPSSSVLFTFPSLCVLASSPLVSKSFPHRRLYFLSLQLVNVPWCSASDEVILRGQASPERRCFLTPPVELLPV
ncbi:hypothetical protein CesoFtcFv8_021616 [Champsocephalus esox]|uniref:Uncharacterized protein n=1 Tax=Champsocephalus esox TaxID=159716 RepID=A0AAN8B9R6_9TELE|nr:hypothetical protein CesoFtcFv8_021616 [Champsocephalus esox]